MRPTGIAPGVGWQAYGTWLVGLLLALSCIRPAQAEHITLSSSEFPPYTSADLPQEGIVSAITRAAFEHAGYSVEIRYRPWARALMEAERGISDGIIAVWYTKERDDWLAFSKPVLINQVGFYARRGEHIDVHNLSTLKSHTIGVVRDYASPTAFQQAHLTVDESIDDETNLRKLAAGRCDLALIDHGLAAWLLNEKLLPLKERLVWLQPGIESMPLYLAFSRKSPGWEKRLADFNAGLDTMRKDGSLGRMLHTLGY